MSVRYIILTLGVFLGGCQQLQEWWRQQETEQPKLANLIEYNVVIDGEIPLTIANTLRQASQLTLLYHKQPLLSQIALQIRAEKDTQHLIKLLHYRGYFDAAINYNIVGKSSPYTVRLMVTLGERYRIANIELRDTTNSLCLDLDEIGARLRIGALVNANRILTLQESLTVYLQSHGYPAPHIEEPELILDRAQKTVEVLVLYNPGILAYFGDVEIRGLTTLNSSYITNRIGFAKGDLYDQRLINQTSRNLMNSCIFESVNITVKDPSRPSAPILIQAVEAPPRLIGGGARYYSSEGLGVKAFWKHYNLFNNGSLLDTSLKISTLVSQLHLSLAIPDVLAPQQELIPSLNLNYERTKAYLARIVAEELRLQRKFTPGFSGSIGALLETGRVKRVDENTIAQRLWGLPLELKLNTTDNPLDPQSGFKGYVNLTPYAGTLGTGKQMTLVRFQGTGYIPFGKVDPFILAMWTNIGNILIRNSNNIPANKRFYAGGAGSVRAYGFQKLGPLDKNGVPIGGRSLTEGGIEGRFHLNETLGGVVFLEGGAVGYGKFSKTKIFWGMGIGARYYTPIGPLRLDLALPLSRKRLVNGKRVDSLQFYVSIGQAF